MEGELNRWIIEFMKSFEPESNKSYLFNYKIIELSIHYLVEEILALHHENINGTPLIDFFFCSAFYLRLKKKN